MSSFLLLLYVFFVNSVNSDSDDSDSDSEPSSTKLWTKDCANCQGQTITCPQYKNCVVNCIDTISKYGGCNDATIRCPKGPYTCTINCSTNQGRTNCQNLFVDGRPSDPQVTTTAVSVYVTGHNEMFKNGRIECPSNAQCGISCESIQGCRNATISAYSSPNTNIFVNAIAQNSFREGRVLGAPNGTIDVYCSGHNACADAWIVSHEDSVNLNLTANGRMVLQDAKIFCPNNGASKEIICNLNVAGDNAIQRMGIYAFEAFHDFKMECTVLGYSQGCEEAWLYCNMDVGTTGCPIYLHNSNWRCLAQGASSLCNRIKYTPTPIIAAPNPTPSPSVQTTSNPTHEPTAVPTIQPTLPPLLQSTIAPTYAPTTVQPSVSPTTFATTTAYPTHRSLSTFSPETVQPSSSPTILFPSTLAPTTYQPTYFPSMLPTILPTFGPTADNFEYPFSVNFVSSFEYELHQNGNLTTNVLNNITITLIETQTRSILNASISSEYDILWNATIKFVVLSVTIRVPDNRTMTTLETHIEINLVNDLYNIVSRYASLNVAQSDIDIISIASNHEGEVHETTAAPSLSPTIPVNVDENTTTIDTTDTTVIIIASCATTVVCCIFLFLVLYIVKLKREQKKTEEYMRKAVQEKQITVDSSQPSVLSLRSVQEVVSESTNESSEEKDGTVMPGASTTGSNRITASSKSMLSQAQLYKLPDSPIDDNEDAQGIFGGVLHRVPSPSNEGQPMYIQRGDTNGKEFEVIFDGDDQLELKQWLSINCGDYICKRYFRLIVANGYQSLEFLKEMQSEKDLEEIGVYSNEDKERLWSEIQKLKDCEDWINDLQIIERDKKEEDEIEKNVQAQMDLKQWLKDDCGINNDEYFRLFVLNGYKSLDCVRKMENKSILKAIGVHLIEDQATIWNEIEKLKANPLNAVDLAAPIGNEEQEVGKWLEIHCGDDFRERYFETFVSNGYSSLDFIKEIDGVIDLKEIGIHIAEHQEILLSEIAKLKQLFAGK